MLDGGRKRFARIRGLSGCEADKLGASKSKSSCHEDGAKAFEAIVEGARIVPVLATNIGRFWSATDIKDDAQDDKANDCDDLEDGEKELRLAISPDAEQIDADDDREENGNPGGRRDV